MAAFSANEYCYQLLRTHEYGCSLAVLLLPEKFRAPVAAVMALDLELRLIAVKVQEEMIAHIRYAWWREGLEALEQGKPPRAHPVLQALAQHKLPLEILQKSVDEAQERWPEHITSLLPPTREACEALLAENPKAQRLLHKAMTGVERHEARYGTRKKPLLALKLLFVQ